MKRHELPIAGTLLLAILGSAFFIASYVTHAGRLLEGSGLAVALGAFAAAAVGWAYWVLPPEQVIDRREAYGSSLDRAAEDATLSRGLEHVTRPHVLTRLLYVALGLFGVALIVPLRSLGPAPGSTLFHTKWRRGLRLMRSDGRPIRVDDVNVDSAVTVFPETAIGDAQSQATLIRLPNGIGQSTDGYIAYSRVCTHAGCPVALYRASQHQLMCPCHQSVFDVLARGKVLSGPADHALPELPIEIGRDGYVRAAGDFPVPVGPGFWERS